MRLDPEKPTIDGIPFDDLYGAPPELARRCVARGLAWATVTQIDDGDHVVIISGLILASSRKQAEDIAFGRGLGEVVQGPIGPMF